MKDNLLFAAAFLEGMASFLSPCVLPLIPAYMTYLTGQSLEVLSKDRQSFRNLLWNSLAFILGFSLVFVALGAAATSLGKYLLRHQAVIRKGSGVLIVFFGLFHTGLIPIAFLNYERRLQIPSRAPSLLTSFFIGLAFSFGWTPCIGPVLSSILIMAGNAKTVFSGILLLAIYSLGLGLPFFLMALGVRFAFKYLQVLRRHMKTVKIISGLLLIAIGIMVYFNGFAFLLGF